MRLVAQRVREAWVSWDAAGRERREAIGRGLMLLVGAGPDDLDQTVHQLADKVTSMRIFPDADGRSNLSLLDIGGEALVVSQFTLYADLSRGRRPSFIAAGDPSRAERLCDRFAEQMKARGIPTRTGRFGAYMQVGLVNDGPVTFVLSSDHWETRV